MRVDSDGGGHPLGKLDLTCLGLERCREIYQRLIAIQEMNRRNRTRVDNDPTYYEIMWPPGFAAFIQGIDESGRNQS